MTDRPFTATVEVTTALDKRTMDGAAEEAVRIGDDYGRVDGVTVQAIERSPIGFDATVALEVGIEQTDIEDAVTAAYEYCRSELSEYDCTMTKIERNQ